MSISTQIFVTFQREGIHSYPAALVKEELKDVSFLGFPHRHMFYFCVTMDVMHDDRDVEFIQFKRKLETMYDTSVLELGEKSCEMIARELLETLIKEYPGRSISVKVAEDNENGAILKYETSNE